ncbi:dTMP kinase [Candidatus Woesebacteria bacterium RIFCSPLOWO2_01_FULL_37_19]|uniref:Thymidylate kinase n=2 Tax=Candidatus Woeseibacteriota TaxID=1752722 RepID=A0A1F8BAM8_9BACT|nr:MAG: dTMP kinase [Candidatus Woesebacteria bacterium RIFCSPHIGHO2_01_FULL_38_26b]OGM61102.1 MAG: dTMP kinase [Candidatus Woesebacteria bacterium RIFCSPLOWO2_01_FULL_37_19]
MTERGKLFVFEGGLGAGKSTQIRMIAPKLGESWNFYREPGSTLFGEMIRDAVQNNYGFEVHPYGALFAYSAARANLVRGVIIPNLNKGNNIGLDRYWYSTYAYQGAEGVSKPIICLLSYIATAGLKPDFVIHYDLLPEIGIQRKNKEYVSDRDRYDTTFGLEFHTEVRKNYYELKKLYSRRWNIIDASGSPEEIHDKTIDLFKAKGIL